MNNIPLKGDSDLARRLVAGKDQKIIGLKATYKKGSEMFFDPEKLDLNGSDFEIGAEAVTLCNDEIARLQAWVDDLGSEMYINCAYCGHRYGPREGTPVAMADVLKEHIIQCPQHPLSHAKDEIARLRHLVYLFSDDNPCVVRNDYCTTHHKLASADRPCPNAIAEKALEYGGFDEARLVPGFEEWMEEKGKC